MRRRRSPASAWCPVRRRRRPRPQARTRCRGCAAARRPSPAVTVMLKLLPGPHCAWRPPPRGHARPAGSLPITLWGTGTAGGPKAPGPDAEPACRAAAAANSLRPNRNGGRHCCQPPLRRAKDLPVFGLPWSRPVNGLRPRFSILAHQLRRRFQSCSVPLRGARLI